MNGAQLYSPPIHTPPPNYRWLQSMALGYATKVPVGAKKDIWSARTWARWAKMDQNRLKMGLIHLFVPKPSWTLVGAILDPFFAPKWPIFTVFWEF